MPEVTGGRFAAWLSTVPARWEPDEDRNGLPTPNVLCVAWRSRPTTTVVAAIRSSRRQISKRGMRPHSRPGLKKWNRTARKNASRVVMMSGLTPSVTFRRGVGPSGRGDSKCADRNTSGGSTTVLWEYPAMGMVPGLEPNPKASACARTVARWSGRLSSHLPRKMRDAAAARRAIRVPIRILTRDAAMVSRARSRWVSRQRHRPANRSRNGRARRRWSRMGMVDRNCTP
jgi:hypothetical protein